MPNAALRPCSTCHVVGCTAHVRPAWASRQPAKRIRGRQLQRLRAELFTREPFCVLCKRKGLSILATIRDHIVPLAEGHEEVNSNDGCQGLCQDCSDIKTQAEASRGRQRQVS